MRRRAHPIVLKLGGELVEGTLVASMAEAVARLATTVPLIVVHGGGREIDAELAAHGIPRRAVDGVRVTDEATLAIVLGVLAGRINTRLVAACSARGVRAVGLTGADGAIGLVEPFGTMRAGDGSRVDLQLVGRPLPNGRADLLVDLCRHRYVPIVASIGVGPDGRLFNVNADTLAAHLAVTTGATELVMAGGTPGVLDEQGRPIAQLDLDEIDTLIGSGQATAGMVAKLRACRDALASGVRRVCIVDGRGPDALPAAPGTEIVLPPRLRRRRDRVRAGARRQPQPARTGEPARSRPQPTYGGHRA